MIRAISVLALAGVILTVLLTILWPARSDVEQGIVLPRTDSGALDGLGFEGTFGRTDGSSVTADVLYFNDGRFWSKVCVPCGFVPGPYRAWSTDEGLRFEGIMTSEDRGRFHYTGIVRGDGRLEARINWRKERWYWTIDKDFLFEGAHAQAFAPASASKVSLVAQAAKPGFTECRP